MIHVNHVVDLGIRILTHRLHRAGVKYHALSYIYLNIPGVSKLQWHPFSVSSSPYDGDSWLKVLIKPSYRGWTHQLQDLVSAVVKTGRCPSNISAAVEGPYGHESDFFLQ